jgi:cytochrome c1
MRDCGRQGALVSESGAALSDRAERWPGKTCITAILFATFTLLCSCAPGGTGALLGGDPAAGAVEVTRHACGSCHLIPGIQDADGRVGPPLGDFGAQQLIVGRIPNTAEALRLYLKDPQAVAPGNVMPNEGLTDREARDIAAFLETQG